MSCCVHKGTIKVKLSLCFLTEHHALKAYWGSGGITPHILNLGTKWRWVVNFTPRLLYPQGKRPWYPLDRSPGGPQNHSQRGGEAKNFHCLPGFEPPIIQLVAQSYTTELSRLLLKGIVIKKKITRDGSPYNYIISIIYISQRKYKISQVNFTATSDIIWAKFSRIINIYWFLLFYVCY
jgi:hypothetical protein